MGPFYDLSPESGFHVLKDEWCQKEYLGEQCKVLASNLEDALKATRKAVPGHRQKYALSRAATLQIDESERERRWERSVFQRWSVAGLSPVEGCWVRLVAFQIPLFQSQEKDGFGYIDLLGILADGTISIVEMKKEPRTNNNGGTDNTETPLRMVLEAATYAIVLQENWMHFRNELKQQLKNINIDSRIVQRVPESLDKVQLVCAAPAAYWIDWLPVTKKGKSRVLTGAWNEFQRLMVELEKFGYTISFLSISGDIDNPESLAAQPLTDFPLK